MPRSPESTKIPINNNYFFAGEQVDLKLGAANSFSRSQSLDFRTIPSQMSVLPAPRLLSNTQDLWTAMAQDLNGIRWGVGGTRLYSDNASHAVSVRAVLPENSAAGMLYNNITDQLYIPTQTGVTLFGQVTTGNPQQPRLQPAQFGKSASNADGCVNLYNTNDGLFDGTERNNAASLTTGITNPAQVSPTAGIVYNTYGVSSTTVSETPGNYCFFAPDIEPGFSIAVWYAATGSGNQTLTLHDSSNNQLASVTISAGNMQIGWNEFVFGKQIRMLINASQSGSSATYHFHLTSSVASDTAEVATINANDLSSVNFLYFAYRLVQTNNGWHPTQLFTGTGKPLMCIGNGQYLATYDFSNDSGPSNAQFQRAQLQFEHGEEVCSLTVYNQYLVIGTERRSTNSSRNYQHGNLYFWSGSSQAAPDFKIPVPMGAPYSLQSVNNVVYFYCAGQLFAWAGSQSIIKVRKMAYQNTDYLGTTDTTIVNPNMIDIRYNLAMLAYPSSTTNTLVPYGVRTWGTVELSFPNAFGFSYVTSNGNLYNNTGGVSNLQYGCLYNFVDTTYISWSQTVGGVTTYGVDILDNSSAAATTGNWYSLIYDGGVRFKLKEAMRLKVSFAPLPAGWTVTPFYILDRGTQVFSTQPQTATNATQAMLEIIKTFHEIQFGFTFTGPAGATTPPIFTGVTLEIDPKSGEFDVGPDG